MQNLQNFNEVDDYLLSVAASLLTPSQGIFAIRPFILPSSLLQLKLPFPFQPSTSTLCHHIESNDSINTSKIKNQKSIFDIPPSTSFSNATRAYLQSAPSSFLPTPTQTTITSGSLLCTTV